MTNPPSGSKRPHPDPEHARRPRERDEPRDWRDIHLTHDGPGQGQGRRGHRGGKDRNRERDRRDRDRNRREDSRDRRDSHRHDDSRGPKSSLLPKPDDAEREEGEISPRPSPEPQAEPALAPPIHEPEPELELEQAKEPDVEDTLAARRARRQAILARYADKTLAGTLGMTSEPSGEASTVPSIPATPSVPPIPNITTEIGRDAGTASASPEPEIFDLTKPEDAGNAQTVVQTQNAEEGTAEQSAADYDPSMDRREDEQKRFRTDGDAPVPMVVDVSDEFEEVEEEEDDDVDDMFALLDADKPKKVVKKKVAKRVAAPALIQTTLDSAADAEGYYTVILGEHLDGGKYQVFSVLGKGMFAIVVRARVLQGDPDEVGKEVAIKITRSQETMIKAGHKEAQVLNKLKQADPEGKRHIVQLDRCFEHRGHLCLVFESLSMNLREVVKRFGKDVGLNIRAVRAYAHQLFLALGLLKKCNIMHADIKPDNILVNEAKTLIKVCDLGSASDASENEITPYLVSRFYRAPEIILGVPYDPALDMWSIGCTLYELYTGKILFPGRSNNQMLLLMMELKGRFNSKLIKRAEFGNVYFDDTGAFNAVEANRVTGAETVRAVHVSNPKRDLRARLMPPASARLPDEEVKLIGAFVDLLDKCLALDPAKRLTPREALMHPFIRG